MLLEEFHWPFSRSQPCSKQQSHSPYPPSQQQCSRLRVATSAPSSRHGLDFHAVVSLFFSMLQTAARATFASAALSWYQSAGSTLAMMSFFGTFQERVRNSNHVPEVCYPAWQSRRDRPFLTARSGSSPVPPDLPCWIAVLTCNSETLSGQKIVFVSSDFTEQEAVRVSQTEVIG